MTAKVPGFRGLALRGAAITGLAQGIKLLVQILAVSILSRLLAPEDFGLVAMVAPITAFVLLLQDLGLNQATIQNKDITNEQISRMFWLNMAVSGLIVVVLVLSAPLFGYFYHEPRVTALIAAWTIPLVVSASAVQHIALLNRNMRYTALAFLEVAGSVASLSVSIVCAWYFKTYWALWAGALASAVIIAALAWVQSGWRPLGPRTQAKTGALLRFGINVAGFNFVNFLSRNLDNIIIARAFDSTALGFYDRAYKLLLFPLSSVTTPVGKVILPILAKLKDDPERLRQAYLRSAGALTFACVPGVAAVTATSHEFVLIALGPQWSETARIFAWFGIAGLFQPLMATTSWVFISQHRVNELFRFGVVGSAITISSFFAGIPWGVTGIAAAYAISGWLLRMPMLCYWTGRQGSVRARDLISIQAPVTISALLTFGAVYMLKEAGIVGGAALVLCAFLISYAVTGLIILAFSPTRELLMGVLPNRIRNGLFAGKA